MFGPLFQMRDEQRRNAALNAAHEREKQRLYRDDDNLCYFGSAQLEWPISKQIQNYRCKDGRFDGSRHLADAVDQINRLPLRITDYFPKHHDPYLYSFIPSRLERRSRESATHIRRPNGELGEFPFPLRTVLDGDDPKVISGEKPIETKDPCGLCLGHPQPDNCPMYKTAAARIRRIQSINYSLHHLREYQVCISCMQREAHHVDSDLCEARLSCKYCRQPGHHESLCNSLPHAKSLSHQQIDNFHDWLQRLDAMLCDTDLIVQDNQRNLETRRNIVWNNVSKKFEQEERDRSLARELQSQVWNEGHRGSTPSSSTIANVPPTVESVNVIAGGPTDPVSTTVTESSATTPTASNVKDTSSASVDEVNVGGATDQDSTPTALIPFVGVSDESDSSGGEEINDMVSNSSMQPLHSGLHAPPEFPPSSGSSTPSNTSTVVEPEVIDAKSSASTDAVNIGGETDTISTAVIGCSPPTPSPSAINTNVPLTVESVNVIAGGPTDQVATAVTPSSATTPSPSAIDVTVAPSVESVIAGGPTDASTPSPTHPAAIAESKEDYDSESSGGEDNTDDLKSLDPRYSGKE